MQRCLFATMFAALVLCGGCSYAQDLDQNFTAEIQHELQESTKSKGQAAEEGRVNLAPNMRLGDRDMHATIVYIDETSFAAQNFGIAAGHVRYLLQGRAPDLPTWLAEGMERTDPGRWSSH